MATRKETPAERLHRLLKEEVPDSTVNAIIWDAIWDYARDFKETEAFVSQTPMQRIRPGYMGDIAGAGCDPDTA